MGWGEEPKSYDGEKAWSSIDHSILFDSVFRIDVYTYSKAPYIFSLGIMP
jgi:hypothetical protein